MMRFFEISENIFQVKQRILLKLLHKDLLNYITMNINAINKSYGITFLRK